MNGYNHITDTPITNGLVVNDPDHTGWQLGEEYGFLGNTVYTQGAQQTIDKFRASNVIRYTSEDDFVNGQQSGTPIAFEPDYNTILYFEFDGDLINIMEPFDPANTGTFTYTITNPYSQQTSRTTQEYNL